MTTLRGILALWVVVGHFWIPLVTLVPSLHALGPLAERGHMAVPAFFVLSGWVLSYNYADRFSALSFAGISGFLGLRLARLYPVHLATLLAVLALLIASALFGRPPESSGKYGLVDFALNLGLVQAWLAQPNMSWNYPSWSISAEWFAYLLFPLATFALHRTLRRTCEAWLFGLTGLVAAVIQTFFLPGVVFGALLLTTSTFAVGMAIHWSNRLGSSPKPPRAMPDLLLLAAFAACFLPSPRPTFLVLCLAPAAVIWSLSRLEGGCSPLWRFSPLELLGRVSYSMYMVHAVVAKILLPLLPPSRWAERGILAASAVAALYAAAVAAGTWACYALVERPSRGKLRSLLAKCQARELERASL